MKKIFGSSWRTTLTGYAIAVGTVVIPIIKEDGFDFKTQWPNLALAAGFAIWGRLTKDSDGLSTQESKKVAQRVKLTPTDKNY